MNKNIKITASIILMVFILPLSSCLKHDLPSYPLWDGNLITNVNAEYRFEGSADFWGNPVVAYQRMQTTVEIDTSHNTVTLDITVPEASGAFTSAIRDQVSKSTLWPYFDISTSATMEATGGTPAPGNKTDFSQPQTYVVKAANGSVRQWTVTVRSFVK